MLKSDSVTPHSNNILEMQLFSPKANLSSSKSISPFSNRNHVTQKYKYPNAEIHLQNNNFPDAQIHNGNMSKLHSFVESTVFANAKASPASCQPVCISIFRTDYIGIQALLIINIYTFARN